jgi:hypothetical protein
MARLLTVDRLAPELKTSWPNRMLLALVIALVLALALGGTALGYRMKHGRPGVTQIEFYSTEIYGKAPGARLFYYPEKHTMIIRGWIFVPPKDGNSYEIWADKGDGTYVWLGTGQALDFVGFTYEGTAYLGGIARVILTEEPSGSPKTAPTTVPVVTLIRPGL